MKTAVRTSGGRTLPIRKMTVVAMLSAISLLLMLIETALPIFPAFLKLDLADLPALIGTFTYGPIAGIAIELIKNLVRLTYSSTGGAGDLANFLVGSALVFPAGLIYARMKTRKGALLGMLAGILSMTAMGALANYFIVIPFYTTVMGFSLESIIALCAQIIPAVDSLGKVIVFTIVPFNLLKGCLLCAITFLIYNKLSPIIKGRH